MRRATFIAGMVLLLTTLVAAPALAHECVNASKSNQSAGVQVAFDPDGNFLFMTKGLENRIAQGVVDPETGEGFHGLVGIDLDGDGKVDASTWMGVGPDGEEIPLVAQLKGPACRGLTNIGIYLSECVSA